ncbi:MAG: DinB family protein [Pseudonocardiaceae bacterium]
MTGSEPKADLHRYLWAAREALLWKLDGLSEYDIRRPLTPTGTNLLGLIKHVASVEVGYFGDTFGRPFNEPLPWFEDDAGPNADMWATATESREQIVELYHRAWVHSDATIGWWPPRYAAGRRSPSPTGPSLLFAPRHVLFPASSYGSAAR